MNSDHFGPCQHDQPQEQAPGTATGTTLPAEAHPEDSRPKQRRPAADLATNAYLQLQLLKKSRSGLSLFMLARTLDITYHDAARSFSWLQTLGHVEVTDPPKRAPTRPWRLYYRLSARTRKRPPNENDLRIQIRTATLDKN